MTDVSSERSILYDLDGLAMVKSRVRLPELESFRTELARDPDLVIEVSAAVKGTPAAEPWPSYSYREFMGSVTANFDVTMGPPAVVRAAPLLALSRHVLYTNVVEPLLRFIIASRGRMLVHAGCIVLEGQGVMLSARTDTGKTATILRLLRASGGSFLSDDMTILSPTGEANRYAKPLTISAHTLRAVPHNRLRMSQRAALAVQSRLHSRSGRGVGKWLGERPLPIMAMNSLVQAVIPPPKYRVDQLVPCQFDGKCAVRKLFLIERGSPPLRAEVPWAEALEQLLLNTADAYEFPPFRTMAPQLRIAGLTFEEVQAIERDVLRGALANMEIVRLRVADFSWPELVKASVGRPLEEGGAETTSRGREAAEPLVVAAAGRLSVQEDT
jgi:dolichol-phosphate mannosyltransferase